MKISQKIIDYAIWYYLKYYPSPEKLKRKLKEKFWPDSEKWQKYWGIYEEEIEFIIKEKLKNIITEEEVIKAKIRTYKNKWKSKRYILSKMYERLENKQLTEKFLEEQYNIEEENRNLKKELLKQKYNNNLSFEEKQKILGKILRKWYSYNNIKIVINNLENE